MSRSYRDKDIYLVGLPGSGKSTLGKALADLLGCGFVDLDRYLEEHESQSITSIFNENGETRFRELESHYLRQLAQEEEAKIVATGGGTPCFHNNMDFMNEEGTTIYLDVSIEVLVNRVRLESAGRPLLAGKSEKQLLLTLQDHLTKRKPYYCRATLSMSGEDLQTEQLFSALESL